MLTIIIIIAYHARVKIRRAVSVPKHPSLDLIPKRREYSLLTNKGIQLLFQ